MTRISRTAEPGTSYRVMIRARRTGEDGDRLPSGLESVIDAGSSLDDTVKRIMRETTT